MIPGDTGFTGQAMTKPFPSNLSLSKELAVYNVNYPLRKVDVASYEENIATIGNLGNDFPF